MPACRRAGSALDLERRTRYDSCVTQLLERAFTEASKLSEREQDLVAAILLEELASEKRWEGAFASSQQQLAALARDALREFGAGETLPMDTERDFPHD
jgi:hypothetical protein